MKKVALVLSGGSAYGFAHIGVIEELEKNNIPIDIITGTSMGALIGGLYSAGISTNEMKKIISKFSNIKIIDLNPFGLTDAGLLYGNKVVKFLNKTVNSKRIEDCEKKFACVSTDLNSGEKYVFKNGDLATAIRASISIPGIFKPVKIDNYCLVDGGASDNLPIDEARNMGADIIIAVDVCSFYKRQNNLKTPVDILISAINIFVSNLVKSKTDKADIYIKIDQNDVDFNKFNEKNALKSISHGGTEAKKFIEKIKSKL